MFLRLKFIKYWIFVGLVASFFLFCNIHLLANPSTNTSNDQINLALRRTGDHLLRIACDSSSMIPAVKQVSDHVWQLKLDQEFDYDKLPGIIKNSFELYKIKDQYQVVVRNCEDGNIELGFHKLDFLNSGIVPCKGRERTNTCNYIEVTFLDVQTNEVYESNIGLLAVLFLCGLIGLWYLWKKQTQKDNQGSLDEADFLHFGNTKLDVASQLLFVKEKKLSLTFRETKLLKLFVTHFEQLLERDFIIQEVWADEGVLVGRSVDVFVSRLRKKINGDPSIGIVSIHGVGYRLETIASD